MKKSEMMEEIKSFRKQVLDALKEKGHVVLMRRKEEPWLSLGIRRLERGKAFCMVQTLPKMTNPPESLILSINRIMEQSILGKKFYQGLEENYNMSISRLYKNLEEYEVKCF